MEKIIKKDGWRLKNTNGSHYQYEHPTKVGKVTIPHHSGDIQKVVVKYILQQAQIRRKP
ncbi:MAG: type II toxin-antitoxin system HicA family toxin [Holophagaceae bacterium]|nr:type II toxin-antitoxin system HicA family toxin [Holophagaceae bacterium]